VIEYIGVFDFSAGFEPTASLKRFLNAEVEPTTLYTDPNTYIGFEQTTIYTLQIYIAVVRNMDEI
jgi:hypothetical protein